MRFNLRYESTEGGKVIEFATGRTSLWDAQDYANTIPEGVSKRAKVDYAWAFFAAQQAGKLEELGSASPMAAGSRTGSATSRTTTTSRSSGMKRRTPL